MRVNTDRPHGQRRHSKPDTSFVYNCVLEECRHLRLSQWTTWARPAADASQLAAEPVLCAAARPALPPPTRSIAANSFISPNKVYQTKRTCPAPCICSDQLFPVAAGLAVSLARAPRVPRYVRRHFAVIARPYSSLRGPFAVRISSATGTCLLHDE